MGDFCLRSRQSLQKLGILSLHLGHFRLKAFQYSSVAENDPKNLQKNKKDHSQPTRKFHFTFVCMQEPIGNILRHFQITS